MNHCKLVYFLGPTGLGKSHWALKFSRGQQTPILNGDSVQVYRHVNLGTAKPSQEEMKSAPHFLYDFVEPPEKFTAGKYCKLARAKIKDLQEKKYIFVVGGSGFYLQALEKGMFDAPSIDDGLRVSIENKKAVEGTEGLWNWLLKLDPQYCAKINKNDSYRVTRGLEMVLMTGKSMAQIQKQFEKKQNESRLPNENLKIGFFAEKEVLLSRVVERTNKMMALGLLDEVKSLVSRGMEDWAPLSSVGYVECLDYLKGKISKTELPEKIVKSTMQLAKRQKTWFQRDKSINWVDIGQSEQAVHGQIKNHLQEFGFKD